MVKEKKNLSRPKRVKITKKMLLKARMENVRNLKMKKIRMLRMKKMIC